MNYPNDFINKKSIYFLELDSSFWKVITLTNKTIKLIVIKDKYGSNNHESIERDNADFVCKWDNKCKHCIKNHQDGSFTIYPYRNGVPYYFRPATNNDVINEINCCKKWGVSTKYYDDILSCVMGAK